ncbi:endoglucanase [Fibrobacteres bacterium R8-0-B4]
MVACFGTNDFSTYPYPTKELFIHSYFVFLERVWGRYPDAKIVCVTSAREPVRTYVREMVERERSEGNGKIHFYSFGDVPKRECGCDWHPNAKAHEKIGRELAGIVEALF